MLCMADPILHARVPPALAAEVERSVDEVNAADPYANLTLSDALRIYIAKGLREEQRDQRNLARALRKVNRRKR